MVGWLVGGTYEDQYKRHEGVKKDPLAVLIRNDALCAKKKNSESIDHLLHCSFALKGWQKIFGRVDSIPNLIGEIIVLNFHDQRLQKKRLILCTVLALLWFLWPERRNRIYEN